MGDRAYHSAQAILWIHIRTMYISEEFSSRFPLPVIHCGTIYLNRDLTDLLEVYRDLDTPDIIAWIHRIVPGFSLMHLQWTSTALLHLSWANRNVPNAFNSIHYYEGERDWDHIPLNAMLNLLLTWCIALGWPVEEEVLKIQDKSCVASWLHPPNCSLRSFSRDRLEQILSRFSQAIVLAAHPTHPRFEYLPRVLRELTELEHRPTYFTAMAYKCVPT